MNVLHMRWRSKQVVYAIFALATASAFMTPVGATDGQTETPEITTVRQFLAGIENHDLESQLSYLTPDAQAYRLRPSSFGNIAMALTSASHGRLWLDEASLRRSLGG